MGRPEWKLVTGWEGRVRESWLQGVCVRDVLSAYSLLGERRILVEAGLSGRDGLHGNWGRE